MTTPPPMPAGWYDDPFTDHLQRYWTGEAWTKETRPRPGATEVPPAYESATPVSSAPADASGAPVRDWLIPSILAIIFCFWPLAVPALIYAIRSNSARKQGDMATAAQQADRARFFVKLSVIVGVIYIILLAVLFSVWEVPADQGTIAPFGA